MSTRVFASMRIYAWARFALPTLHACITVVRDGFWRVLRISLRSCGLLLPRNKTGALAARPERHTVDSLDSLAVDIARMIDHDAAAELWDRYKRGERNVFTRKLYTMQGQKAFEEIRKRYRADADFKRTVDRYVGEFERLLEEVSRDDRGQMLARTYLTSETGKVYTMLAHAAGRFD